MRRLTSAVILLLLAGSCLADKTMYVPDEWRHPWNPDSLLYKESDPDNAYTWSKTRSRETDNIIVLWDKGYGDKAPDQLPKSSPYYVDINDLLQKCEEFFNLEINTLGFVDPQNSNLAKYKVMVLMNHTTDWACYGGGYDYQVSALWLSPNTCKPVGSAVAHEIGHSFHYMCYAEGSNHGQNASIHTGFHGAIGKGAGIWEQTAQWQSLQSYPKEMFSQSINVFRKSHNLAFTHEWHRYQSYWFLYYICQYFNDITSVANVWNYKTTSVIDFNQALMRLKGWKVEELFRRYYDYASRCATWDFDVARDYRDAYVGDFEWRAVRTADNTDQVAAASAPQTTGFNIIPLRLPDAGATIIAHFTALKPTTQLANGDPGEMLNGESQWVPLNRKTYPSQGKDSQKGFRLGFVALLADGTRQYFSEDSVYCRGTGEQTADVQMQLPDNISKLWMVVSPAPTAYNQHLWDDNPLTGDYIWPYSVRFEGTDVNSSTGKATIYVSSDIEEAAVHDITFDYNVQVATNSTYDTQDVVLSPEVQAALAYAFQLQPNKIASMLVGWSNNGPATGEIMYCTANADGVQQDVAGTNTNATYGHWFGSNGELKGWGNGAVVYCDFEPSTLTFRVGYHPANARTGQTYTVTPALQYHADDGTMALARFRLHVTTGGSTTGSTELQEITDAITSIYGFTDSRHTYLHNLNPSSAKRASSSVTNSLFDLSGRQIVDIQTQKLYIEDRKVRISR